MNLSTPYRAAIALSAALLAYGAVLVVLVGAVPGGADSAGYFNEAHLFAHLRIHEPTRTLASLPATTERPFVYVPLGYRPAPDGSARLVPTYPPGFPLLILAVARTIGWRHAGDIVMVLHSLAGLALTYALGRRLGLSLSWSMAGVVLLAASPLYLFMSLWAMSDVPAMAWVTAAMVLAWKSRERPAWALAAGACAAVAFLVRPSNCVIALPMAIVVGLSPRRVLLTAAGGLPGVVAWMAINHAAYGGYLQTGYVTIGNEFHESIVSGTFGFYMRWLPVVLCPLVLVSPSILAFLGTRTRMAASLAVWAAAYLAFYAPYRWTHMDWWYLRFLLPAAPALLVSALMVLQWTFEALRGKIPGLASGALVACLFIVSIRDEVMRIRPLHAWSIGHGEEKYGRVADKLKSIAPKNSVVIAEQFSGADYYFNNLVVIRAAALGPGFDEQVRQAVRKEGRPVYLIAFPPEQIFVGMLPGKWVRVASVEDVAIWRGDWGDPGK